MRRIFEGAYAIYHLADLSNDPLSELIEQLTFNINHKVLLRLARLSKNVGLKSSYTLHYIACMVSLIESKHWM